MAGPSKDYRRGEMDISEQASTYDLVMNLTKWGSLIVAVLVLWLTLWFGTAAGFFGATIGAVALAVVGFFALKKKPGKASH